jgi:nucleoside 2-deoxyribosyltransferase
VSTPSVYLCAAFARQSAMRDVRSLLSGSGIGVTARWLDLPAAAPTSIEAQAAIADVCLEDIHAADALIAFTEDVGSAYYTGGRHVEVGIALAAAVPVYVVGPVENVFHCHARVTRCRDVVEELALIRQGRCPQVSGKTE